MPRKTSQKSYNVNSMKQIVVTTLEILLVLAIIGTVVYGVCSLIGFVVGVIYVAVMIVTLLWIAIDIQHAIEEDDKRSENHSLQ